MPEFEWKEWMERRVTKLEDTLQIHMGVMTDFVTRDDERKKTLSALAIQNEKKGEVRDRKQNILIALAAVILTLLTVLGLTRHKDGQSLFSHDATDYYLADN